jgi:hypothetical protein
MITEDTVRAYARQIADMIIVAARTSGPDPIAWVTSNAMMPPLRWFALAERVWQDEINDDGEAFAWLAELVESHLSDANVALECPDYDNALYAVDLARFEYVEDSRGETLQDDWQLRPACATCGHPLDRNGADDGFVHLDDADDTHVPVLAGD